MDLRFLRGLYELPPPFASVTVTTARHTEDAAEAIGLRWRHARDELAATGATEPILRAIEEVVTDPAGAAPGRVVFAAAGRVGHTEPLPEPPPRDSVGWGPLPDILPFLLRRPEPVPHVRVLTDRKGADIVALGDHRTTIDVQGRDWPIQKVREGGWSEQRYQRSAVENWRENAKQVAEAVREAADDIGAELIILGGDLRARELLLEQLGDPLERRAVLAEHGARGQESQAWEAEVAELLHGRPAARRRAAIESFGQRGITGLGPVVTALREGRVDTLLVDGEPPGELWFRNGLLAMSEREMHELGEEDPLRYKSGAVLVRAAVGGDASLEPVDTGELDLTDQVGALPRY
jgi:hypothetical protein